MTEEELKAIELLKEDIDYRESDLAEYNETKYSNAERTIINLVNKQQKEIEELRKENFDTVYMQAIADYKSKIKGILGIEGNTDIEFYLKHLVAENNRLEDIEDRKVQVAVDNIEKKRDKYWGDKIREILKNYLFTEAEGLKEFYKDIFELVREIDRNNEDLFTLGELEYAISHSEEFDFGGFNQETIEEAVKTIKKLDKIIQSFESGEMITGVKNVWMF